MKKFASLIMALTLTVGLCAVSLYTYSYKTVLDNFGESIRQKFVENVSNEKLSANLTAISNFFIARPRAYLRQSGALSSAPDALATAGQMVAANVQDEPMIIDRVPITARIQVVYLPKRISMSFSSEAAGSPNRRQIATAGGINDS